MSLCLKVTADGRGSTLSLAYAETHPDSVAALIVRGIYLSRRSELDFTYKEGANRA